MRLRWTISVFDKFNIIDRQKQANYYLTLWYFYWYLPKR